MSYPGNPDGPGQDPNQPPYQQPNQQPNQPPYQPQPGNPQQGTPGPGPYQQGGYQQGGYQQGGYPQSGYQQGAYQQGGQFGGPMPPYGQANFKPVGDPGTLDLPWYGIGFGQAISRAFKKYVRFDGRASRSEFWWFYLFNFIVSTVLSIPYEIAVVRSAGAATGTPQLGILAWETPAYVWGLAVLLPTLGITWRRLHDTNRTGAWWFLNFACGIGGIVPLIMCILDSDPEGRRFDRVPTGGGQGPGGYPPNAG